MNRWWALTAVSAVMAGSILLFPATSQAYPAKFPIPPIPIPGFPTLTLPGAPNCKPPPAVRSSASGNSAMFDGTPADTGGHPATSIYERYGVHAFSWAVFDPGCIGDAGQPAATVDTFAGNETFGLATDLVALSDGLHNLVAHPTWLGAFDRMETATENTLTTNVFDVFVPLSLTVIGLLLILRSHRGNMAETVKIAGWALLVLAISAIVFHEPTVVGRFADKAETSGIDSVAAAIGGGNSNPAAVGTDEVQYVLYPAWLRGEIGSDTSATAAQYGPALLDGTAYQWTQLSHGRPIDGKTTKAKQKEFMSAASAISKSDPGAYDQLKGQAGGRFGAGVVALVGALATVPFRMIADLLTVAALLLVRLEVVFLPLILAIAIHYRFRGVFLVGVVKFTGAALLNALVFAAAASVNVLLIGFVLDPTNGIPTWFGLVLAAVLGLVLFLVLKPFRKLTHMVTAAEIHHAVSHGVSHEIRRAGRTAAIAGAGAATGGVAGAAGALAGVGGARRREELGDSRPVPAPEAAPEPPGWVNQPAEAQTTETEPPPPSGDPADMHALDPEPWLPSLDIPDEMLIEEAVG